jgi:hypothetical protein
MRKHNYSLDYFHLIDTPLKSYWLGFIAADGCVQNQKGNHVLSIGLAIKDKEHLTNFATAIGYDQPIRISNQGSVCSLNLYSKELVVDLNDKGITPRKTFTIKPWSGPPSLMEFYWRGVFDGDGTVGQTTRTRNGRISWNVGLVGNENMVNGLKQFIAKDTLPYSPGSICPAGNVYRLMYNGTGLPQLAIKALYKNEMSIGLSRKKERAMQLLAIDTQTTIARFDVSALTYQLSIHGNWEKVAKALGVSRNGLYKHIRRLGIPRRGWKAVN